MTASNEGAPPPRPDGIYFNRIFEGALPRTELLIANGSIIFRELETTGTVPIFAMLSSEFFFEFSIHDGAVWLSRNGITVSCQLEPNSAPTNIAVTWSPTTLAVYAGALGKITRSQTAHTPPTLPPNALLRWARRQSILPVVSYPTEAAFRDVIINSLAGLTDKVRNTRMQPAFWDFEYDGGRIVSRRPKRETQVQPTVHGLLHDIALAKNLEIYPEARAGGGQLDFLVTASGHDGKRFSACIEFKNAHSDDVEHGLLTQLPEYMRSHGTDSGFYCVNWFRGERFLLPEMELADFKGQLVVRKGEAGLSSIGLIFVDLSEPVSPSKL